MTAAALVVAGGSAQRFGGDIPKQYRSLAGIPVIRHSILAFLHHPAIRDVAVVIRSEDRARYDQAVEHLDLLPPVLGGDTRQASVCQGLEALRPLNPDHVLIHDAARPLLNHAVIDRVLTALDRNDGACVGVPVADSLKRASSGRIIDDVARADLWRAQTPQAFRFQDILKAHTEAAGTDFTDDVGVARASGIEVAMVDGDETNFKVTTMDDLVRAEQLLKRVPLETRVGQGFDVHRFEPGTHVRLCGVDIAHDQGLAGHSDADVALHALTDALLGALGEGDIGEHFPPSDDRWRDADSAMFLRHAVDLVTQGGGRIVHVDLTIICEAPKLSRHKPAMRERIAEILDIDISRVGIKATTTEGLGFAGRREGIAAQAVATIERRI